MKKTPLGPRFGLEIADVELTRAGDELLDDLLDELDEHGLLLFRRQSLVDEELHALCRRIGALEESARRISHAPGCSTVSNLTNLADPSGRPLGFPGMDTDYWHSDQEFRLHPATLASLYCLIPSPIGGATSFASTALRNLDLPPRVHEAIRHLAGIYVPAATHDNVEKIEVSHPVWLVSPRSGKVTVYVSENTQRFPGLDPEEGRALKETILRAMLDDRNVYSHRWRTGDLVFYDNTQLLHRRERFEGPRWLKGTKIFAPPARFAVPPGERAS